MHAGHPIAIGPGRIAATLLVCSASLLAGAGPARAYENPQEYLEIPFIDVEPRLDEFLDMRPPAHLEGKLARVSGFVQREPNDGARPSFPTEVYVAYDHERLYAIFIAFDDEPDKIRANMAPRGNVFNDDSVNIMIDTFNDQRRAYFFLSTPLGIQADGQFIEGRGFDGSFEAVWDADGRLTDRGFVVRIAVPFASIRFPRAKEQTWRVIFNRMIPRLSEDNFWPQYSRAIEGRLNQTALMTGIREISPGRRVQLVPFGVFNDFRNEIDGDGGRQVDDDHEEFVGLDAKIVLNDAFVLDVTANPDFSQIESDEPQVTVNQRYEVFFPERRPFFLENADLFQTPTNLVFSRRIKDPGGGLKLTGKRGRYAVGLLVANDEAPGKEAPAGGPLEGEDAGVGIFRLSRDISDQSRIGLLVTDREVGEESNRVAAVDGRIKLNDNWVGEFQVAAAGTRTRDTGAPGVAYEDLDGVSYNLALNRSGTHLSSHAHYLYTSPGFRTDLGFLGGIQRPDSQILHESLSYRFRPVESKLAEWGPSLFVERVLDSSGNGLDWTVRPAFGWKWVGDTRIDVIYQRTDERLQPEEFAALSAPRDYAQHRWLVELDTDRFTTLGLGLDLNWGRAINFVPLEGDPPELADFRIVRAEARWRPIPPLRLDFALFRTELRDRNGAGRIFVNTIGRARANWQFTKELSLRLIADFEDTDPVWSLTSLPEREQVTLDALVKYLWNPWWALYAGTTSHDLDTRRFDDILTTRRDEQQVFVKFSYLFQL